ncbi:hypothetical protein [Cytobacillus gottheilii]|uniref:hypothetical protein n=1 Tax=Cytobacillus gottheilii TaxID=859144 RepID=UPI001118CD3B|nr:hypothetical protein [Cytobacillus gottheilii]
MLRKCEGFILTDLFLSLSALVIIGALLMPYLIRVYEQKQSVQRDHEAVKLLYEQLMESEAIMTAPRSDSFLKNGEEYKLLIDQGQVCVRYENGSRGVKQVCERFERTRFYDD